ncbi:MAG: hypothetical protein IPJ71_15605 [Bdellovibrionales bacterium]|nr:hypothetical protein [Bdellovibrionales bacterium]
MPNHFSAGLKFESLGVYFLLVLIASAKTQAATFSSRFNESKQNILVNQIANAIKSDIGRSGISFDERILKIQDHLKSEVQPWSDALGIEQPVLGTSQIFWASFEYFSHHGFIFSGEFSVNSVPKENWMAAYNYYSTKTEIDYLNKKIGSYLLSTDPKLVEKLREILPLVENMQWPIYRDKDGFELRGTGFCETLSKNLKRCNVVSTGFGDEAHPQHAQLLYEVQKAALVSSPLFLWLLEQPLLSVTYSALFAKALEIYKSPWVALGAITFMTMSDAHAGSRQRGGVVASRLEPIIDDLDLPGHNYHFWGYLLKGILGNYYRFFVLSFVHEKIIQNDVADWTVDQIGLSIGSQIRSSF